MAPSAASPVALSPSYRMPILTPDLPPAECLAGPRLRGAGKERLEEHRLLVPLEQLEHHRLERARGIDVVADGDPLRRALVQRLGEERQARAIPGEGVKLRGRAHEPPVGGRNAARAEDLLGPRLVEAECQRERVAAGIRNAVELADGRDVRLAVRTAKSFGDVEDDVGAGLAKTLP